MLALVADAIPVAMLAIEKPDHGDRDTPRRWKIRGHQLEAGPGRRTINRRLEIRRRLLVHS